MTEDVTLLPLLTVVSGPLQGASFRLRPGTCTIGRGDGVDVLVDDFRVSRRHAAIEMTSGRATLADTGSTNGTWLNQTRLTDVRELRDGDRIRVGGVELRFYDPSAALTDPVGTMRFTGPLRVPAQRNGAADGGRRPAGALSAPTQPMVTGRRFSQLKLVVAGCLLLVAWATWALLIID